MSQADELPAEVARLCHLTAPYEVVVCNRYSCIIRTVGLELRFKVRSYPYGWEWDEIVGQAQVHIEQMSGSSYWIGLDTPEGRVSVFVHSASGRAAVIMTGHASGCPDE